MMNNNIIGGSSSSSSSSHDHDVAGEDDVDDWGKIIDDIIENEDLDSWYQEILAADRLDATGSAADDGLDTMTFTPNSAYQPAMSTINGGTNLGGSSSNVPQSGNAQEMTTVSSLIPSSSATTMQNEGIISSAVKYISTISAESSQSARELEIEQLLHQLSKGKAVEQPTTHLSANQTNMTFGDQKNQLQYQMPSNSLLHCTGPMGNTQTGSLQNSQALRVQMQQNLNQNQLQLQQATGSSSNLISRRRRLLNINLSAPVGFSSPSQFATSKEYRVYVLRQIRIMKERYYNEIMKMSYTAMELRAMATNTEAAERYEKVQTYLEKMMTFLSITRVNLIPKNDYVVYNYMNTIVNYVSYHMSKRGGVGSSSQPARGPHVQPLGNMMLQNSSSSNMSTFNQNFPSRRPQPQSTQSRSSLNCLSLQRAANPLRIDSFKAPQSSVLNTSNISSVIGSSSTTSLFSSTSATNYPSRPLNSQPPSANQNLNLEKMKAPMHITNGLTESKVNQCSSSQLSLQSIVNPTTQQTSSPSSKFDVNKVLSPESIARSPFLLSSNSSTRSKQCSSGIQLSSTADSQKAKRPMDPPSEEPKSSKDQVFHLAEVVKSMSSNALLSTLTDISSIEKEVDKIPQCVSFNLVGTYIQDDKTITFEYDHEQPQKMRREFSVTSVDSDPLVSQGSGTSSEETSSNKKMKIETKQAMMEEIKEINSKLLETSINVVIDSTLEDDINMLEAHEETIVKCLFRSVCFPDLRGQQGGISSEKMPEFVILLLVPANYPASSPKVIKSTRKVLNSEPWGKLYDEMLTKLDLSLQGIPGILSLGDMARNWNASARAVMTEFMEKRGAKGLSSRYGNWENCMSSSSS